MVRRVMPAAVPDDAPATLLRGAVADVLHLDDTSVVDVALATVVANGKGGDPLWLLLVNPASTAKTELVQLFRRVEECAWLSEITENTFLSGLRRQTKNGPQSVRQHSLLFRWTDPKLRGRRPAVRVVLIQDLTGLITARREKRDAVFGQLRQIYDGRLVKSTGMGEDLAWEGYLGMLGAVTQKYDDVAELYSILGERFILFRPLRTNVDAEARVALTRAEGAFDWRGDAADVATRAVAAGAAWLPDVVIPDTAVERLIALARLTSAGRATVVRDGYTRVIRTIPEPEGPARLAQQFRKLLRGLCAVRALQEPGEPELAVIAKTARDTLPSTRLAVMRAVYQEPGTKLEMASRTRLPPTTVMYLLQDLTALGVTKRQGDAWELTREFRRLADQSGFFGHDV